MSTSDIVYCEFQSCVFWAQSDRIDPCPTPRPTPSATIPLAEILGAISNPARWNLLRELASGEPLMLIELAERVGQSLDTASKNMAILRKAGIAIQGRNRLYSLAPQFIANKAERILDFGYCVLRLNVGVEPR